MRKCVISMFFFYSLSFCILLVAQNSLAQQIKTEKNKFLDHVNSVKALDEKEQLQQAHKYLSSLTDSAFFSLMKDITEETPFLTEQNLFVSHLKSRWGSNPPVNSSMIELSNKQNDTNYRKVMIDYLTWSLRKQVRSDTKSAQTIFTIKNTVRTYKDIISDKTDRKQVRLKSISQISSLLALLRESDNLTDQERVDYGDFFISKLADATEDEYIRGRSATALRSLDDKKALPYLRQLVTDSKSNETFLTRSAIMTLAKMRDSDALMLIANILGETNNEGVFRTTVYALGLYKDPVILRRVFDSKERFEPRVTRLLLRDYENMIEDMLKSNNRTYLVDAINIISFAELSKLTDYLFPLVTDSDIDIRKASIEAFLKMGKKEDLKRVVELTASENDPSVLALLQQVRAESNRIYLRPDKSTMPTDEAEGEGR